MSSLNSNRCYLVMWPEDQESVSNTAATMLGGGGQQSSRRTPSPQQLGGASAQSTPLRSGQINGGRSSTSSEEGGLEVGNQQPVIPVTRLAYHPVILSGDYQQQQDTQQQPTSSPSNRLVSAEAMLADHGGTAGRFVTVCGGSTDHGCSKCLLKESENRNLRKRVQALEEQLCRAISKKPKLHSSLEPTVITLAPQNLPVTTSAIHTHQNSQVSQQLRTQQQLMSSGGGGYREADRHHTLLTPVHHNRSITATVGGRQKHHQPQHDSSIHMLSMSGGSNSSRTLTSSASSPAATNRQTLTSDDDRIELVPGTNVLISTSKLQQILSVVKTGKQLARKLMSIYWDRSILARSTLSASSQHYEQLDPNTISAIKTYCVLFDSSSRKSEIHSTMIDKCVQARRPRRSSLRQMEHVGTGGGPFKHHEHHATPTLSLRPQGEDMATPIVRLQAEDYHSSMMRVGGDSPSPLGEGSTSSSNSSHQLHRLGDNRHTILLPSLVSVPQGSMGGRGPAHFIHSVPGGQEEEGEELEVDDDMSESRDGDETTPLDDLEESPAHLKGGDSPTLVIHVPRKTDVDSAHIYNEMGGASVGDLDGYYGTESKEMDSHALLIRPREGEGLDIAPSCQTVVLDITTDNDQ